MIWRSVASNALTLLLVVFAGVAVAIAWGKQHYNGPGPLAQAVCVDVKRGATLHQMSDELLKRGAISHDFIFRLGANYQGLDQKLKYGSYLVPQKASMRDILTIITSQGASTCGRDVNYRIGVAKSEIILREIKPETGEYVEVARFDPAIDPAPQIYADAVASTDLRWQVTVAEGVTGWQVADSLKRADFLEGPVEKIPAEGSLAPDAYAVEKGTKRADLIADMARKQSLILSDLWQTRAANLPYDTPEEALIMASIIEKETGIASERGHIAGVFVNRLRKKMRLQTDPTVIYGITEGKAVLGRGLRQSELRRRTRYNTYMIDGLPPTPIANPGRLSIEAALNPAPTDDLYFVADGTGGHVFAPDLLEHNANVARWRKIEGQEGAAPPAPEPAPQEAPAQPFFPPQGIQGIEPSIPLRQP